MGRLIDSDKLVAHLKDEIEGCKPLYYGRGKSIAYGTVLGLKSAIAFIEALATIEAEPVVHGEWIDDLDENGKLESVWRKCSMCGCLNHGKKSNYCPNCGAKMKGDTANND